VIEAKSAIDGKQMLMAVAAVMPVPSTIIRSSETFVPSFSPENLRSDDFPLTVSILRI
jgi:hypothetical protein